MTQVENINEICGCIGESMPSSSSQWLLKVVWLLLLSNKESLLPDLYIVQQNLETQISHFPTFKSCYWPKENQLGLNIAHSHRFMTDLHQECRLIYEHFSSTGNNVGWFYGLSATVYQFIFCGAHGLSSSATMYHCLFCDDPSSSRRFTWLVAVVVGVSHKIPPYITHSPCCCFEISWVALVFIFTSFLSAFMWILPSLSSAVGSLFFFPFLPFSWHPGRNWLVIYKNCLFFFMGTWLDCIC